MPSGRWIFPGTMGYTMQGGLSQVKGHIAIHECALGSALKPIAPYKDADRTVGRSQRIRRPYIYGYPLWTAANEDYCSRSSLLAVWRLLRGRRPTSPLISVSTPLGSPLATARRRLKGIIVWAPVEDWRTVSLIAAVYISRNSSTVLVRAVGTRFVLYLLPETSGYRFDWSWLRDFHPGILVPIPALRWAILRSMSRGHGADPLLARAGQRARGVFL